MKVDYNVMLYDKIKKEYEVFIEKAKTKPPDEIIELSYEKVFKEEILVIFENNNLPQIQAKALYTQKKPLENLYQGWLKYDCSYLDMLRDSIDNTLKKAVRDMVITNKGAR